MFLGIGMFAVLGIGQRTIDEHNGASLLEQMVNLTSIYSDFEQSLREINERKKCIRWKDAILSAKTK